jgi:hypothetical protein
VAVSLVRELSWQSSRLRANSGVPPHDCPGVRREWPNGKRTKPAPLPDDFEERIVDIDVGDEMPRQLLEYAYW